MKAYNPFSDKSMHAINQKLTERGWDGSLEDLYSIVQSVADQQLADQQKNQSDSKLHVFRATLSSLFFIGSIVIAVKASDWGMVAIVLLYGAALSYGAYRMGEPWPTRTLRR